MVRDLALCNSVDITFLNWRIAAYYRFVTWSGLYSNTDVGPDSEGFRRLSRSAEDCTFRFEGSSITPVCQGFLFNRSDILCGCVYSGWRSHKHGSERDRVPHTRSDGISYLCCVPWSVGSVHSEQSRRNPAEQHGKREDLRLCSPPHPASAGLRPFSTSFLTASTKRIRYSPISSCWSSSPIASSPCKLSPS